LERLVGEKITLKTHFEESAGRVRIDLGQFEQVLLNLTSNARDAVTHGGTITLKVRGVSEYEASIEISDDGMGMDSDTVSRNIEPFFTTKERGKGTGLGLASVRGIVEQHGGAIFVDSEIGEGTSIEVILPTTQSEQRLSSIRSTPRGDFVRGDENILVVEDDPAVRLLAKDALEQLGYKVFLADGLATAVAVAESESLDLVLSDVVLQGADGPRVRDAVLAIQDIPCLFMTGHADDRLGERGFVSRGTEVLRKPFTVRQLGQRLRQVLDARRREAQQNA
jgi:CheY-like chemotaxis protein